MAVIGPGVSACRLPDCGVPPRPVLPRPSLQHLLLLLQFGRLRVKADENFWMALEEPELHVPPALQRRLVHRIQSLSRQTLVSTHSPMIAALADPAGVAVLRNEGGILTSVPLLQSTLPADTPNSIRKLFQVNRVETIAAVMHDFVLIPEGRTDYEWFGLLVRAVDLHQSWAAADECRFDAFVGVIPTHDGSVVRTVQRCRRFTRAWSRWLMAILRASATPMFSLRLEPRIRGSSCAGPTARCSGM